MFTKITILGSMISVLSSCLKRQTFDSAELHNDCQVSAGRHPSYWGGIQLSKKQMRSEQS